MKTEINFSNTEEDAFDIPISSLSEIEEGSLLISFKYKIFDIYMKPHTVSSTGISITLDNENQRIYGIEYLDCKKLPQNEIRESICKELEFSKLGNFKIIDGILKDYLYLIPIPAQVLNKHKNHA